MSAPFREEPYDRVVEERDRLRAELAKARSKRPARAWPALVGFYVGFMLAAVAFNWLHERYADRARLIRDCAPVVECPVKCGECRCR